MKPPSSDPEALRDQQAAQVRAADGFLVAADKGRDLERRQQTVRKAAARGHAAPAFSDVWSNDDKNIQR